MSFTQPTMELNLYRVEILRSVSLVQDGDRYIAPNYNDSPFLYPEIIPATRVGRWNTVPSLDNFVELDPGQRYQIKITNYTWKPCHVNVRLNQDLLGRWIIPGHDHLLIDRHFHFDQLTLIEAEFQPNHWTDATLTHIRNPPPPLSPRQLVENQLHETTDYSRETIIYVRLVPKQRYQPYQTCVGYRQFMN